jgi:hypothetical protein
VVPVRAARITGRVMDSNGSAMRAQVSLTSQMGQQWSTPTGGGERSVVDGTFTLNNIPPGSYTLHVRGATAGVSTQEVAVMSIVIAGEDVTGLTIFTGSGASILGTVVADNGSRLPAARMAVEAIPLQRSAATWSPRATVAENGTFALDGLAGIYSLRLESLPAGWMLESMTANGLDVSDVAIELQPKDRVSVRIELTDRITRVSGSVRPNRNVRGGTVVMFADDSSKWTTLSRYVKTTQVADDGTFSVSGLPPHQRYLAVALDYVEQGEVFDPEFLQRAKAAASEFFSLSVGSQRSLDLPLTLR